MMKADENSSCEDARSRSRWMFQTGSQKGSRRTVTKLIRNPESLSIMQRNHRVNDSISYFIVDHEISLSVDVPKRESVFDELQTVLPVCISTSHTLFCPVKPIQDPHLPLTKGPPRSWEHVVTADQSCGHG